MGRMLSILFQRSQQSPRPPPPDETVVVVTGTRPPRTSGGYGFLPVSYGGRAIGSLPNPFSALRDEEVIEVEVDPSLTLTDEEQQAVNDFKDAIAEITRLLPTMSDTDVLILPGGQQVTVAEFKAVWAKSDYKINPPGTPYPNGEGGQVNPNGGNPIIEINLDTLMGYSKTPGGLTYLALHEVSHAVPASVSHNESIHADHTLTAAEKQEHERMANDIARAISDKLGLSILPDLPFEQQGPRDGYSPSRPQFTSPPGAPMSPPPIPPIDSDREPRWPRYWGGPIP